MLIFDKLQPISSFCSIVANNFPLFTFLAFVLVWQFVGHFVSAYLSDVTTIITSFLFSFRHFSIFLSFFLIIILKLKKEIERGCAKEGEEKREFVWVENSPNSFLDATKLFSGWQISCLGLFYK